MDITDPVSKILNEKGSQVWSIPPDALVYDAIATLSERNIGALPVTDGGKLVGVISERDYTRKVVLKGRSSKTTTVREVMSPDPVYATPTDSVEDCMRVMTEERVRHLPVVEDGKMIGIISIGDLVNWIILAQGAHIEQLQRYITGEYPA